MKINNPEEISPNLCFFEDDGWYMFVVGEKVRTPRGTGFVVEPLEPLDPGGYGRCYVQLDGHEDDGPTLFPCSVENSELDAVSLE